MTTSDLLKEIVSDLTYIVEDYDRFISRHIPVDKEEEFEEFNKDILLRLRAIMSRDAYHLNEVQS